MARASRSKRCFNSGLEDRWLGRTLMATVRSGACPARDILRPCHPRRAAKGFRKDLNGCPTPGTFSPSRHGWASIISLDGCFLPKFSPENNTPAESISFRGAFIAEADLRQLDGKRLILGGDMDDSLFGVTPLVNER